MRLVRPALLGEELLTDDGRAQREKAERPRVADSMACLAQSVEEERRRIWILASHEHAVTLVNGKITVIVEAEPVGEASEQRRVRLLLRAEVAETGREDDEIGIDRLLIAGVHLFDGE